jgi:hypothetical protein
LLRVVAEVRPAHISLEESGDEHIVPVVLENLIGGEELTNQRHLYQNLVGGFRRTRACNIVT